MTTIKIQIDAMGVAELILSRPKVHNALNAEMIAELTYALDELANNSQVRVLCLQGEGESFCAGADLKWMQQTIVCDAKENLNDALRLSQLMEALYHFPKPTLAITQGSVYGGGVGLAACCDIAISLEAARFCLSETKLGLVPAVISPYLAEAIGTRAMRYLVFSALPITAKHALALGLIHEVLPTLEELMARKSQLCTMILQNGPQALIAAKQLIQRLQTNTIDDSMRMELAELIAALRVGQEAQERMTEFLRCSIKS